MNKLTRRAVLKTTLTGLTTAMVAPLASFAEAKPRLAFSTLGCPKWDLATILNTAVAAGYQGVEFRGLEGELDLTKSPAFSTAARAAETRNRFADRGVRICNLGSSAQLHHVDAANRTRHLNEARRFIDLAQQLDCPFVRVFPDQLPPDQDRAATLERISTGLLELGRYAKERSVTVLLESHGELTRSDLLLQILRGAEHPNVGLIWDIVNMWADAHETPGNVYSSLAKYIRHVHVKDVRLVNGKHQYVLVGEGQAPLREAIGVLRAGKYQGYYSFEWEKLWHPDIDEPERAIPHFPTAMKAYW